MRILTLGAGTVGTWISDMLCRLRHDVTVIDIDPEKMRRLNDEMDVRAITGSASQSSVLFQAGVMNADLCLAVTGDDEVNLVAASMAKAMGARKSIARVYSPVFRDASTFDYESHFTIDRLVSLEHLTAMELARSIRNPESLSLEYMARGQLEVYEFRVKAKSPVSGMSLRELTLPSGVRIGTIHRAGLTWVPSASDQIKTGDSISLIGKCEDVDAVRKRVDASPQSRQTVVIAGGGEAGFHLARALESERFRVLIIDRDIERCNFLASNLAKATVVRGDATQRNVLEEERVGGSDFFVGCTGNDENNIMAGVEAKELGAKSIMAVVGRPDYANVVGKLGIDVAVSERDVMARQIRSMLTDGAVDAEVRLPGGQMTVLEITVQKGSPITNTSLADAGLPPGTLVAAIMERDFVKVPSATDILHAGSTALVLSPTSEAGLIVPWFETPR
jgi:trk system potassium uptake protein TrkA